MLHYPVRLTTEGERVLVDFPDFPEAHTFGDTREEALTRASDALLTVIDAYMKDRQRLPQPSRGEAMVNVPPLAVPKIELYNAMQHTGFMQSSGLCGVSSAGRVGVGDRVDQYSA